MELVNRLPKPEDPEGIRLLDQARQIFFAKFVDEDDIKNAENILQELALPKSEGGFDYFPAYLTLASLYGAGFEPGIPRNEAKAAQHYLKVLSDERVFKELDVSVLEEAAIQFSALVKGDVNAGLGQEELSTLELIVGRASVVGGGVASWLHIALTELQRNVFEAQEDPEARKLRLEREAARNAAKTAEVSRQRTLSSNALARAEDLKEEGNDACRQGQLPGNIQAKQYLDNAVELYGAAATLLTETLPQLTFVPEEAAILKEQRSILYSNMAQVSIGLKDWTQVRQYAKSALEDSPGSSKAQYRLAKAHTELEDWQAAAKAIDGALSSLANSGGTEAQAMCLEFWKLAEQVSKALPEWRWSCARPKVASSEDFEKRIVGKWMYGVGEAKSCYEIKLEPWGALFFMEGDLKIDLLRKSKLRWRGEYEMISGMVLHISYEPGADVVITEFEVPQDIPEEQRWQGPTRFTGHRVQQNPGKAAEPEEPPAGAASNTSTEGYPDNSTGVPTAAEAEAAAEAAKAAAAEAELAAALLASPTVLWLSGDPRIVGKYERKHGLVENNCPVYRRAEPDSALFLWFRGGNWGVTERLHASSFAAPFLARFADLAGTSRNPLDVRRPRWFALTGRGREDIASGIELTPDSAAAPSVTPPSTAPSTNGFGTTAADDSNRKDEAAAFPAAVELRGRSGNNASVNGCYRRHHAATWGGKPVYWQDSEDSKTPLAMFYNHGFWVIAPELQSFPRAVARRSSHGSPPPGRQSSPPWEILSGKDVQDKLVTVETRTYTPDRAVWVSSCSEAPSADLNSGSTVTPKSSPAVVTKTPHNVVDVASTPSWVRAASVELIAEEVLVLVTTHDGIAGQPELDVSPKLLKVSLPDRLAVVLELPLPAAVDIDSSPVPRWSAKTKTLRVRLALG
jgi:hypothetical protein